MIRCPACGSSRTHVYAGEVSEKTLSKHRKRSCHACNARWNTYEFNEADLPVTREALIKIQETLSRAAQELSNFTAPANITYPKRRRKRR